MERALKSSPNAESTVRKFLKWFAASLVVSPFSLSSLIGLANFALYGEDPTGSVSFILRFLLLAGS